jgi:BirA family transcriptional regulator, biotin operon repressor / biotin---[acetyl-CoA-carboxylase] ligase
MSDTLGHPRLHLRRTDSTNERARALAIAGAPGGTLVTASEQVAGRGRQGRTWWASAGSSLLMSILVRNPPNLLSLIAGVAVCDAVGDHARVKWPNDVVVQRPPNGAGTPTLAKLAGILLEGRPQEGWAVLGIGVNVAVHIQQLPSELRASAASLQLQPAAIEPLLGELLAALERRLTQPRETLLDAWRARDALYGQHVVWELRRPADEHDRWKAGRAEGVDGEGRLMVRLDSGAQAALSAGEVHLAPRAV